MILTVGIPVYNENFSINRALASILNQSWTGSYEILIVDDGSTDDTVQVVENLAIHYPQIRLVKHEKNMGRPVTRSTLAREARGEWFAMLDADDEWYPDKIQRQFDLIAKQQNEGNDVAKLMVCGNIHHIDRDKKTERIKNFYEGYGKAGYDLARVLKSDNTPISQLAILRTDFMREIGDFDPQLRRAQDWDFLIRFFLHGGKIEFLPNPPLAIFNFRRGGRDPDVVEQCMMAVIDKHLTAYNDASVDHREVRSSIQGYIQSFREEVI
ncbi:glycosyltransferase family 2 protein [uncultured Hoeflea sp.]|uniref:glycosyltransferase family 2 protein n=1 Tax=uncultured Hoeflea sp. TaxID=538666 RepID=UPI0030DB10E8